MINELWLTRVEACWQRSAPATARRTYVQNIISLAFSFSLSLSLSFSFSVSYPIFALRFVLMIYIYIYRSRSARFSFRRRRSIGFHFRYKELAITTTHIYRGRARATECARNARSVESERRVNGARARSEARILSYSARRPIRRHDGSDRERLPGPSVPPSCPIPGWGSLARDSDSRLRRRRRD